MNLGLIPVSASVPLSVCEVLLSLYWDDVLSRVGLREVRWYTELDRVHELTRVATGEECPPCFNCLLPVFTCGQVRPSGTRNQAEPVRSSCFYVPVWRLQPI